MRTHLRIVPVCLLALMVVLSGLGCSSQPIAIVNGQKITKQEFTDRLEQAAGNEVLMDLIARKLIEDAFAKSGLQLTQQEIDAEVKKAKANAPDEAAWQDYLKQQNLDEAKFLALVTFNLKVQKLAFQGLNPTDEDLKKEFAKYPQDFARPATVILSEIVVSSKAEADKLRKQLSDPKASFTALARQYSLSTFTRDKGGRREEQPLDQVSPEQLRTVVKSMQVGQISQPVKVGEGWYIIKVDEKRAAEGANFAKIKDKVREHYLYTHGKQIGELVDELRKTANVSITDPRYQKLSEAFAPPQQLPTFGGGAGSAPAGGGQQPAAPATGAQPAAPAQGAPAPAGR